ncbi:hypothetical protein MLD38_015846 [Melastoma candidum]|uniref:Uncharacterized protein n=1 Tax=Melastoma candidum TaxID=119954 RepID=A0ACB9RHJ0_9MYRT|nr:hypothetical protein MLD38_015846 [Melastoma candidum]
MRADYVVVRGLIRIAFVFFVLVAEPGSGYSINGVAGNNSCDASRGSWLIDKAYPIYYACPFIEKEFNCQGNGRPDRGYLHYRWQPSGCNLPRFGGWDFLNRMRGKKLMFVGD